MKVLDLFSGIGGFSVGLERAGFETVAFCEIEDYPRAVLRKHWPDTPIYNDIRELTGEQLRADGIVPDVICGGYPCQPFSVAGKQKAEDDPRHLWPEMFRLICECRPRWIICENVSGHIKLGLDSVLSELEGEGYTCWTFVIGAVSVGAPHRRDRLWIVAHANGDDRWNGRSSQSQEWETRLEHWGSGQRQPVGETDKAMAYADSKGLEGQWAEHELRKGQEKEQTGGSCWWAVEPDVGRVVDGLPHRSHRIKALGNAVVPQIPEMIGHTIMRYEAERWQT